MTVPNNWDGCTAVSCVRQLVGQKTPSSFLIERTCRHKEYCPLGNKHITSKHRVVHERVITIGTAVMTNAVSHISL